MVLDLEDFNGHVGKDLDVCSVHEGNCTEERNAERKYCLHFLMKGNCVSNAFDLQKQNGENLRFYLVEKN